MLKLMQDVAEEVINPRFRALLSHQISEKNPGDLVTVADHESEVLLTEALTAAYPDAVVLGEEAYAHDPALLDRFDAAEHAFTAIAGPNAAAAARTSSSSQVSRRSLAGSMSMGTSSSNCPSFLLTRT